MWTIINKLIITPKRLFLIDAIGAFLTTFLISVVLKTWNEYIGMPERTLTILSLISLVLCVYSLFCFSIKNGNWKLLLKIIAISNLLYCCLTLGLVTYNFHQLTVLGVIYFGGEVVVICVLVFVELVTLRSIKQR